MNKSKLANLKNRLIGRGASRGNLPRPILALGILAAVLAAAILGCDGMSGMPEDISGNTSGANGLISIDPTKIDPQSKTYFLKQTEPLELVVAPKLENASGLVRIDWYATGMTPGIDPPIQTDYKMPGEFARFNPLHYPPIRTGIVYTEDDEQNVGWDEDTKQFRFFAQLSYPAEGAPVASESSNVAFISQAYPGDIDADGYPDAWEIEHASEGYNPKVANTPYGIDLSLQGATPLGVELSVTDRNEADTPDLANNEYIVFGAPDSGITQYKLYNSNDGDIRVENLTFAADVASGTDGSLQANATVIVSKDVKTLVVKSEGNSGGNLLIESGADVGITLQNINLTGGAPIKLEPGAKLTLKLQNYNRLEAGVVYHAATNTSPKGYYAAAGIEVPERATLIIEKSDDLAFSGTGALTAIGGLGDGTNSSGSGAGIGGGYLVSAGDITIKNDCGGSAESRAESSYAVGPGEGGDPNTGSFNGAPGSSSVWQQGIESGGIYTYTWTAAAN